MSIRPKDNIRDSSDVLPEAVWIALSTNLNIKTLDPLDAYMKRKHYVFCDRTNSKRLIGVKFANSEDLEFEEYSENPVHGKNYSLHTFKCMQYTKNSEEDKQQIQNVANLILTFCNEIMSKRNQSLLFKCLNDYYPMITLIQTLILKCLNEDVHLNPAT